MQGANTSDVQIAELTEQLKKYKENGALAVKRIKLLTAHKEKMEKEHKELKAQLEAAGPQKVPMTNANSVMLPAS